jgi:formylglycine-generating enzyme required for sulfatase activity
MGERAPVASMDMVWIAGGAFRMGSDDHYPEERPVHRVRVEGFWIDRHPVTNAEFRRFVDATGYVTLAEKASNPSDDPETRRRLLEAGGLVFVKPSRSVDLRDVRNWWRHVPGADWRHPRGPNSSIGGREDHPVVQVGHVDAVAYAQWAAKDIPTEAEWEFAARGGLDGAVYAWGDELTPDGRYLANTWQGEFPWHNARSDGFEGTSPVGAFPPNGYGLLDMIGNVWEWTDDGDSAQHPEEAATDDAGQPSARIPRRVVKGGSHLCAPNYYPGYRPGARYPQPIDTPTCHIGFRCIVRPREID